MAALDALTSVLLPHLDREVEEGHWLLDGIDPEGYQIVVHTVPAVGVDRGAVRPPAH